MSLGIIAILTFALKKEQLATKEGNTDASSAAAKETCRNGISAVPFVWRPFWWPEAASWSSEMSLPPGNTAAPSECSLSTALSVTASGTSRMAEADHSEFYCITAMISDKKIIITISNELVI